jgi:hypothetical protein
MSSAPLTLLQYASARETLLQSIWHDLEADPHYVAAWLGGSFGRGEQDALSDLDLFVVVADDYAADLCARSARAASGSIPARLALYTRFGEPVNIHENQDFAPANGCFSAVLYHQPPIMVDWTLMPRSAARRPACTRLLFDQAAVPVQPVPNAPVLSLKERAVRLSERAAFFWMMAAVTAKYIVRGDAAAAQVMLTSTAQVVEEAERLLERDADEASQKLYVTRQSQTARLLQLCERLEALGLPRAPRAQVEMILNLRE